MGSTKLCEECGSVAVEKATGFCDRCCKYVCPECHAETCARIAELEAEVERLRGFVGRADCGEAALKAVQEINATSYFAERDTIAIRLAESMYAKGREDERRSRTSE